MIASRRHWQTLADRLHDRRAYGLAAPILTLFGAGTAAAAPALLSPAEFGRYLLISGLFQYAAQLDLGLSTLTDRTLALPAALRSPWSIADLLWSRLAICLIGLALGAILILAVDASLRVSVFLAVVAGMAFMLSDGAVAVFRSAGEIGNFTASALTMQLGMGLPRLLGLVLGGVAGAFFALSAWYVATVALFAGLLLPQLSWQFSLRRIGRILREALPLFSLASLWWLYILSARAIAACFLSAGDLGQLGIGLTLLGIATGLVGTVAQVHYPKYLAAMDLTGFLREFVYLLLLLGVGALAGIAVVRFALPLLLPRYAQGMAAAGSLLLAGIPLCLCSWLMPVVTATSTRPVRDGLLLFGASELFLVLAMAAGSRFGLEGIAWSLLPAGLLLLAGMALVLNRVFILTGLWPRLAVLAGGQIGLGLLEWAALFGHGGRL